MELEKLMYHICHAYLESPADQADAVQEALIKAWQKRNTLHDEAQFRPWLIRILRNQCKDMLKKRKRESLYPLAEETALVPGPEPDAPVIEAIAHLKAEQRLVIHLHYLQGCSLSEMAVLLQVPVGTVKSRMRSARKALGRTLFVEWEENQ